MMKDFSFFPKVKSETIKVYIVRLADGRIVARTEEEIEAMRERGETFEIVQGGE